MKSDHENKPKHVNIVQINISEEIYLSNWSILILNNKALIGCGPANRNECVIFFLFFFLSLFAKSFDPKK